MQASMQQNLAPYYHQRVEQLQVLKLVDILVTDGRLFWSPVSQSAPALVTRLIEQHLALSEMEWQAKMQDSEFCLGAIQARTQSEEFFDYDTELAHAHNRLTREFTTDFCQADGSIDWTKLLRFNSGKS